MYNMDISLFGFKLNLEVLILIGIVYLILVGHTVCGCCNMPRIMEGLSNMVHKNSPVTTSGAENLKKVAAVKAVQRNKKEGFTGANTNYGLSSSYTLGQYTPVDTSSWGQPTLTVTPGQPLSKGVQDILNREPQPVPLPEGEMLMFANTPFKPECCSSTYSNSSGCACMDTTAYNYLVTRAGNNVPYSEY